MNIKSMSRADLEKIITEIDDELNSRDGFYLDYGFEGPYCGDCVYFDVPAEKCRRGKRIVFRVPGGYGDVQSIAWGWYWSRKEICKDWSEEIRPLASFDPPDKPALPDRTPTHLRVVTDRP